MDTEKFEVLKGDNTYHYTGIIVQESDRWITISTIKNELLTFRREQIMSRKPWRDETNARNN